jgi:hypothetical protein
VRTGRAATLASVALLVVAACGAEVSPAPTLTAGPPGATATATATASEPPTPSPAPPTPVPSTTQPPAPTPAPSARPAPSVQESLVGAGSEPTVTVGPRGKIAVVVQDIAWPQNCGRPAVRFSSDGGRTWSPPSQPWGSHCLDIHAIIAWGASGRLWAADAMGVTGGVRLAVTSSDDLGHTWAAPWIEPFTPAWSGCFPTLAVDMDASSRAYGTLYVAYNWLPSTAGPGLHVLAKPLHGPWVQTEVPAVGLPGYPAHDRIGYRLVATSTGALVSFYEADLRRFMGEFSPENGAAGNVGRQGFATAAIGFDGTNLTVGRPQWATTVSGSNALYLEPQWQSQVAVDTSGGASRRWLVVESGGRIRLGRTGSTGAWTWITLGAGFKPVLAVSSGPTAGIVFVGWHVLHDGKVQNEWALSYDHGRTWTKPRLVSGATWVLPDVINGTGLRENATYGDGRFYWAWADTRSGPLVTYLAAVRP